MQLKVNFGVAEPRIIGGKARFIVLITLPDGSDHEMDVDPRKIVELANTIKRDYPQLLMRTN
jgi:hypothetical protein